jgi:O-antigen/teichoic acid export membrane protein
MNDPQPALGDGLTGAELEDAKHADLLKRSIRGANVLLVRGLLLRVISASTNFALIALVLPTELGIFAVVRGALATVQFTTELGFELAMIRRRENPTHAMLAAVAGLRTLLLIAILVLAIVVPHASDLFGVLPKQWSNWLLVAIAAMLVTPIQTSCKVALERDLRFAELSLLEVKGVFIQNIALVAFAFAHRFVEGVFITQIALCFYYTIALYRLVPIRRISFDLRPVRALAGDSIGFSTSTLVTVARDSFTPIVIARFFGLEVAGLWNFAWRIGQFLSLTFEGYLRAGVAASSRLAARMASLRELAESTLKGAAQIAFPIVALAYAVLPLLAILLPKWGDAVVMAQLYVLTLGVAGVYTAALSPVALALRGPRASMAEQVTYTGVLWVGLVLMHIYGLSNVAITYAAGLIASAVMVYALTQRQLHVPLLKVLSRPLGLLAFSLAISIAGATMKVSPWIVAPLAGAVPAFVLAALAWQGRTMLPGALRELRGGRPDAEPATSGAAS